MSGRIRECGDILDLILLVDLIVLLIIDLFPGFLGSTIGNYSRTEKTRIVLGREDQ